MKRVFYSTLFFLPLIVACTKSTSDYRASGSGTVVIKGFEYRNDYGIKLADIGIPDINLNYPSGELAASYLAILPYPNPANDLMSISIMTKPPFINAMARVWIVPATFNGTGSEETSFLGNILISPAGKPLMDTTFILSSNLKRIRIKSQSEGYFRLYLKSGGFLLWDNIIFLKIKSDR
ncbi:MAG: hypothetical protein NTX61_01610 [Bacteroidetes bacterium]|nr:hypothetical protein [Bacteroidota bacterium]